MPIRSENPSRPNTIASRIIPISTTMRSTTKPRIATIPQPAAGNGRCRSAVFIAAYGSRSEPDHQSADEHDDEEVPDAVDDLLGRGGAIRLAGWPG